MNVDEVDMYTREPRYGPVVNAPSLSEKQDKEDQDFILIRTILMDMLYSYSHRYQDKKDKMISNMTAIAKQTDDLNVKRLIAHCIIFPTILEEFNFL
jgi:hypothetical protein